MVPSVYSEGSILKREHGDDGLGACCEHTISSIESIYFSHHLVGLGHSFVENTLLVVVLLLRME
uniref:Uncharacterized protein n=1 Tax=Anopheles minimus TaxID=112268 RepID=A0A182WG52_9DIPT